MSRKSLIKKAELYLGLIRGTYGHVFSLKVLSHIDFEKGFEMILFWSNFWAHKNVSFICQACVPADTEESAWVVWSIDDMLFVRTKGHNSMTPVEHKTTAILSYYTWCNIVECIQKKNRFATCLHWPHSWVIKHFSKLRDETQSIVCRVFPLAVINELDAVTKNVPGFSFLSND